MLVGHDYTEEEETKSTSTLEREVSREEGNDLARELGCKYVEACAKTGMNVEKVFYDVVIEFREEQKAAASNSPRALPAIYE